MKSGTYTINLEKELEYKSFLPTNLSNLNAELNNETINLLIKANSLLGELNGISTCIENFEQFIYSYIRKEALCSSLIEGIQATLEDIFDSTNEKNINADVKEVVNYVNTLNYSIELLDELPICNRYVRDIHKHLLTNIRGSEKSLGEFRKSQNWIGHASSTIKNASYVPPNLEDMNKCLYDLENYVNEETLYDELIKIALIHYQFETIHPFLDGNGRVGRILINLYLLHTNKLIFPCLPLSYYLKRNQFEYYDKLTAVRNKSDYISWINFFLKGVVEIASESIICIKELVLLKNKNKSKIKDNDLWLLEYIEINPIIDSKIVSDKLNIDYYKVNRTINKYVENKILKVSNTSKKRRCYIYSDFIEILKK